MGIIHYLKNQFHHDRNIKQMLRNQNEELKNISSALNEQYIQNVREKTLTSKEMGISSEKLCDEEVVVSLTSYGERIFDVHLAIESIMQGTVKPNRIVLWLSEDEFKGIPLPKTLEMQVVRGLQIEFCEDIHSYKKLVPSLKKYPEATIVTIDDDVMYEYDLIERLINAHITHPHAVCACRMHRIKLGNNEKPLSYLDWEHCISDEKPSELNFPTGVGGVLYPPNCFNDEVLNSSVFMEICPKADDIWFYCMAKINSTKSIWVKTPRPSCYFHDIPITEQTLSVYNTDPIIRGNDIQLQKVYEKYNLF